MDAETLRWAPITAADVEPWAELTNLLARVDDTDEVYEADDLAEELGESGFTADLDSWAVWSGSQLVAFGQLRVADTLDHDGRVRCSLDGGVHPDWRGRGIGRDLIERMEVRAGELAGRRHPGVPAYFRCSGGVEGASVRRLLAHRGYRVVRWFRDMRRSLPGDRVEVAAELADGVRLREVRADDQELVRVAHNGAFRDHWGSTPTSPARWHDYWTARSNRFAVSTVAVDELGAYEDAGAVLAYVLVGQWSPRDAYVNLVGTVAPARGRGLALACLESTIARAAASGDFDRIELGVDAESPTGATRLYERAGFSVVRTTAAMVRDA